MLVNMFRIECLVEFVSVFNCVCVCLEWSV